MNKKPYYFFPLFCLMLFVVLSPVSSIRAQTEGAIYIVTVEGEITPATASFLEQEIDLAHEQSAAGLLIEISTLGGRVDSALAMRDKIIGAKIPLALYIKDRAISAGALIAIASPNIAMAPGSHLGAAKPQPDDPKTVAFVRGEFQATAELTGRDPLLAAAMVDESIVLDGVVRRGEILDLTAEDALELNFIDHIAVNRKAALSYLGWDNKDLVERQMNFRHRIARFLTSFEVASLLLSIGLIALIIELYTPGFGLAGTVAIICFVLYFSSGFIAGYTNIWAGLIFLLGLLLLFLEVFIPGFGLVGISGLIAMGSAIVLAAPTARQGLTSLLIALVAGLIVVPLSIRFIGRSRWGQRLILAEAESVESGYIHSDPAEREHKMLLVGQTGQTLTPLRPTGAIRLAGLRMDASTQGEFIAGGQNVTVLALKNGRLIVQATDKLT